MSTSCRIGYLRPDNRVESIYCHWDGYPEGVGQILKDHYTDPEKIEALMRLGDISRLGYTTEHLPKDWASWEREPERTICYRDRGEVDIDSHIAESEEDYRDKVKQSSVNYGYLFKDGRWEII